MLSKKVPNTLLSTKPNLKNAIFTNNSATNKYNFFRSNFTLRELSDVLKSINNVKDKMRMFIRNDMVFRSLQDTVLTVPRTLKNQSAGVLRVWAHQCECVFAQRLRRGQQMFCLYTKLWEERALKELLNRMRHQITKRGKELMFSAIGVAAYNWENNRISTEDIIKHMNELDYIHLLTEKTLACEICCQEQSDTGTPHLCGCSNKTFQKKTFDDWVPFIEKQDMLVWRRLHDSGHYEYKVYGSFNDVSAEDFLSVQIDSEYRKKWDTTAITLEVVEKDPTPQSNSDVIYWEMLWPKLFANRDYVFNRRFMIDCQKKTIIIISRETKHPACPIRPDKYRVENYWSYMVIKPYTELDKPGIEFGLTYFDNPGVNIPSAVTTWVAMRAMPDFLIRLREATREYKHYCEKAGSTSIYNVFKPSKQCEEESQRLDEIEEIITDNTIFEPQHPLTVKAFRSSNKSRSSQIKEPVEKESAIESSNKTTTSTPGSEIMTSPSPTVQADSERRTYWKYFRPNYYFS